MKRILIVPLFLLMTGTKLLLSMENSSENAATINATSIEANTITTCTTNKYSFSQQPPEMQKLQIEQSICSTFHSIFTKKEDIENSILWKNFFRKMSDLRKTNSSTKKVVDAFFSPLNTENKLFCQSNYSIVGECFKELFNSADVSPLYQKFLDLALKLNVPERSLFENEEMKIDFHRQAIDEGKPNLAAYSLSVMNDMISQEVYYHAINTIIKKHGHDSTECLNYTIEYIRQAIRIGQKFNVPEEMEKEAKNTVDILLQKKYSCACNFFDIFTKKLQNKQSIMEAAESVLEVYAESIKPFERSLLKYAMNANLNEFPSKLAEITKSTIEIITIGVAILLAKKDKEKASKLFELIPIDNHHSQVLLLLSCMSANNLISFIDFIFSRISLLDRTELQKHLFNGALMEENWPIIEALIPYEFKDNTQNYINFFSDIKNNNQRAVINFLISESDTRLLSKVLYYFFGRDEKSLLIILGKLSLTEEQKKAIYNHFVQMGGKTFITAVYEKLENMNIIERLEMLSALPPSV